MPIYKIGTAVVNRIHALAMFLETSRLTEANTMLLARNWADGRDLLDTVAGRTLRENVRRSSVVRIIFDAEERTPWDANGVAVAFFNAFKDERAVFITALKAKNLGPLVQGMAVVNEFREWLTTNYILDDATREAWLLANKIELSAAVDAI